MISNVCKDKIPSLPNQPRLVYDVKYTWIQLKHLCRLYHLRVTGNKSILKDRLYHYLNTNHHATIIQSFCKKILLKKYIEAKGPGFIHRSKCINVTDFCTWNDLKDISTEQFISYNDKDGNTYGFDIVSLYTLMRTCNGPHKNPYTREILPPSLYTNVLKIHRLSKFFFKETQLYPVEEVIDDYKRLEMNILSVFQYINSLGNYSEYQWLWCLNRKQVIRFIRELLDIWVYRANITCTIRELICPNRNPFVGIRIHTIRFLSWIHLMELSLDIIRCLVTSSNDEQMRCLGSNYVLCALTLVNEEAAVQLPWLYQSVV